MHKPVDAVPELFGFFDRLRDVIGFGHIHLENLGHWVKFFGGHLRDAHHPAEAREQDLRPLTLRFLGDRITNAPAIRHAGNQDVLALEDHSANNSSLRALSRSSPARRAETSRSRRPRTGGRWAGPRSPSRAGGGWRSHRSRSRRRRRS